MVLTSISIHLITASSFPIALISLRSRHILGIQSVFLAYHELTNVYRREVWHRRGKAKAVLYYCFAAAG